MNSSREDYIQSIYRLSEKDGYTSNKEISKFFGISKSSVSEMIKKLKREDYLDVNKNKISLTEKGESKAKRIISAHRLWEYFLSEHLGLQGESMHKQADLLEHVTGEELLEKLNEYLSYPEKCPCGKTVYVNK